MLKNLFGSQTRVKLLQIFLLNPDNEYFVRELTRKLNEQINSVRRELINLKKIGFLKHHARNRKKYYFVDKAFILFTDLKNIVLKTQDSKLDIAKNIGKLGGIDLLVLSGIFTDKHKEAPVDLLIVGDIDKERLENYLEHNVQKDVKYSIMDKDNFLYRLEYNDKFIINLLKDKDSVIPINRLKQQLEKVLNV
jgi:predicted transcriptional regulator